MTSSTKPSSTPQTPHHLLNQPQTPHQLTLQPTTTQNQQHEIRKQTQNNVQRIPLLLPRLPHGGNQIHNALLRIDPPRMPFASKGAFRVPICDSYAPISPPNTWNRGMTAMTAGTAASEPDRRGFDARIGDGSFVRRIAHLQIGGKGYLRVAKGLLSL